MHENITYRKATSEDCHSIALLKGEVWNTTYRGIYPDDLLDNYDIEKNELTFLRIIANQNNSLYVGTVNDKIIGFMSSGEPYKPFQQYKQEMGLLYILKEYQRRGIGRKLFSIAKEDIKNKGYNEFFVSVNKYNANAINFYIAMGGTVISVDQDKENKYQTQIKLHYSI